MWTLDVKMVRNCRVTSLLAHRMKIIVANKRAKDSRLTQIGLL